MSFPINENILNNNASDKPSAATHVLIEINGVIMDSNGVTTISTAMNEHDFIYHHVFDVKFLVKSINNIRAWSDIFDRNYVPKMAKKLNIKLGDVKI